jgi:ADP-dependent NAD(P)H-hydrate dehydratase / NAD(P)H-hydrate epimerase
MRTAWRVADVRAAEKTLMATLPDGTLMARAAAGLARRCAELIVDRAGSLYGRSVLLLVGAGDNGGDALYAGALLARRGVAVRALLLDPEHVHPGGLADLLSAGGRVVDAVPAHVDLVMDGIVGIGGRPPLRLRAAELLSEIHLVRASDGSRPTIVAVDVPSGVNVDTGAVDGPAVDADVTVAFGCLKPAHVVGDAAPLAGFVALVDIGLQSFLRGAPALRVAEAGDVASWWPLADAASDKYKRGVIGVATGSAEYPGAALLSVAGASAGPVGMVRYAGGAGDLIHAAHPPVIVSPDVDAAGRVQAWTCGSGFGTDDRALSQVKAVLAESVPVLLDADALTLISGGGSAQTDDGRTSQIADLLRARSAPLVVTPHDREFARLAGHDVGADRVQAALALAAKMRATVLLKGDRTVVAAPDGTAWVNSTGTPALATGGSGDVLAGLIGSLLAAGLEPAKAAVAGAFVHGLAGRLAASGGRPVTSADVAAALPAAIASLLSSE